jgi:acetoin utilization protein AcuC
MTRTAFIYSPIAANYVITEEHPLRPTRVQYTYELLDAYGAFGSPDSVFVKPEPATDRDLLTYHSSDYIDVVKRLSRGEKVFNSSRYNITPFSDNPPYEGMYDIGLLAAGASMQGGRMVTEGICDIAFNVIGGYHHAMVNYASGFCVFNDIVVAIKSLLSKGLRVAYVDIDAHHADGVQNAFHDTSRVLSISLHESGKYLFPGTGDWTDIGTEDGEGYTINVPLEPYTNDEIYLWVFNELVPPLVKKFKPDVLVTQLGCDTHYLDPLAHLQLTTGGYCKVLMGLKALCPKWLAIGGGGYDVSVVARCWTLAYGVMMGREWPDETPAAFRDKYGIPNLRDSGQPVIDPQEKEKAWRGAQDVVANIKHSIFPLHTL